MSRPSQNLTALLHVRMTPEEKQRLREAADTAGVDLTTLTRSILLNAELPRRARRKSADHQALARVLAQLGKIGGNLNQTVKMARTMGDLTAFHEVKRLMAELAAIRELIRDALAP